MRLSAPIHQIRVWLSDLGFSKTLPTSAELKVPYFSQFMSAELVERYIEGKEDLSTDQKWQQSGASDTHEYERWTWSDCGIACFKMVLAARDAQASSIPLVQLAKEAAESRAFKLQGQKISPLHYAEFCTFARNKYGLKARSIPALSVSKIKEEASDGHFVIVSVHPSIRHPESTPPKRGGHLVLVVGYDDQRGGFYIHNPSGYQSNASQNRAFVPYDQFKKFFAYRGIILE